MGDVGNHGRNRFKVPINSFQTPNNVGTCISGLGCLVASQAILWKSCDPYFGIIE